VQALAHLPGWTELRHDKVAAVFIRTHPL